MKKKLLALLIDKSDASSSAPSTSPESREWNPAQQIKRSSMMAVGAIIGACGAKILRHPDDFAKSVVEGLIFGGAIAIGMFFATWVRYCWTNWQRGLA
jgi:hypothetical protein